MAEPAAGATCQSEFSGLPMFSVGQNAGTSALADLDGDGDLDLTTGRSVLWGQGDGSFLAPVDLLTDFPVDSCCAIPGACPGPRDLPIFDVVARDFDGDGILDIALTPFFSECAAIIFRYGRSGAPAGELPFEAPVMEPLATEAWHLACDDFNGDRRPDLVAVTIKPALDLREGTVALLLNLGGRAFERRYVGPQGVPGHSLATGDFDGDSLRDIAYGEGSDATFLFGRGDGTFREPVRSLLRAQLELVSAHRFRAADMDGDGRSELVAGAGEWLLVYLGAEIDPFSGLRSAASRSLKLPGWARFLEIRDMNGDGVLDIASQSAGRTCALQVFYGEIASQQAGLTFTSGGRLDLELAPTTAVLAVGDVNGDGAQDMVITAESTYLAQVFLNKANCQVQTALAGDSNADGILNISDAIGCLGYLFLGGDLACLGAAEVNSDDKLDLTDPVYLLRFLFMGGDPLAGPELRECR